MLIKEKIGKPLSSALSRGALVSAIALAAMAAQANPFSGSDPVTGALTFEGASDGYSTVNITYSGLIGGPTRNVSTGQFMGTFDPAGEDATAGAEANDFFRFFCIDLAQYAYHGTLTYTRRAGVPDAINAWQLTRLFENVYPNQETGNFLGGGSSNFGDFASADASAAMQLAVWEIWFDDDLALSTGLFKATGAVSVVGTAQGYLDAINSGSHTAAPGWQLYRFENGDKQDYLSATYSTRVGEQQTVPLPGTLPLLGIGLAGLGFARARVRGSNRRR